MTSSSAAREVALTQLQTVWETYAKDDPLWAIASHPAKMGRKWNLTEFLQTGTSEIDRLMQTLTSNDIDFDPASALDFGCGVGRLTKALAPRFGSVCGVDISPTMIKTAEGLAQEHKNCRFFVNARQDLQLFKDAEFSFIYSSMVLQHIPPDVSLKYLAEFARILRAEGLLIFHLPTRFILQEGLPPAAWRAAISCSDQSFSWPASSMVSVELAVRNESPVPWQYEPRTPVMLGNHWLDSTGRIIRQDDGRALLPNSFAPGEEVVLTLQMKTPPSPGSYKVEFDLVQESVAWFKDRGSRSLELPADIIASFPKERGRDPGAGLKPIQAGESSDTTQGDNTFEGFSMYCIPRSQVVHFLHTHGLRLEFIEPSNKSGPGYQSYVYFARKWAAS